MAEVRIQRRHAASLAADVVWYCRLIGEHEAGALVWTLPPWKPVFPLVLPQRWPSRPSARPQCRSHTPVVSSADMTAKLAGPVFRQSRSKLAPSSRQASKMIAAATTAGDMILFFMPLRRFPFIEIDTPNTPAQGEQIPPHKFDSSRDIAS